MVDGIRKYLPSRESEREASEEAQEIRRKQRQGSVATLSIGELSDRWLDDVRRTRKVGTWTFYAQQIAAVWHVIPRAKLAALVNAADMRLLINEHQRQGYSAQTIQHRRAVLRRLFRWAAKCGLAGQDPTTFVDWPKVDGNRFDVIPADELRAILERIQSVPADYDLMVVALYSGLRRGELARLRVEDIDFPAGVIWVGGKTRNQPVPIDDVVAENMRRLVERAPFPWLLPESRANRGPKRPRRIQLTEAEDAEQARGRTVANCFRRWAKRLGDRRLHPHTLRHSLATELVRDGSQVAGRVLRHRDPATTAKYVHLVASDERRAKARLRLLPGQATPSSQQHGG